MVLVEREKREALGKRKKREKGEKKLLRKERETNKIIGFFFSFFFSLVATMNYYL